jgi:hypothetical protein
MSAIGKRVRIVPSLDVGQHHWGRRGEIVSESATQFGVKKCQVRIDMQGRETVQQTVWIPARSLRVQKATGSAA